MTTPQNIDLTDTGIVALETILTGYQRQADDAETLRTLRDRVGDVMENAHTGMTPMESQTHKYFIETDTEQQVLIAALEWATEAYSGQEQQLARHILADIQSES